MTTCLKNIFSQQIFPLRNDKQLSSQQVLSILHFAKEHFFLYDSNITSISTQQSWTLQQESRKKIMSCDIPIYQQIFERCRDKQYITNLQFGKSVEKIQKLNPTFLQILKNIIISKCSLDEVRSFVDFVKVQSSINDYIRISQIDEWRYHNQYNKSIYCTNDLISLINILTLNAWQKQILLQRVNQIQITNSRQNSSRCPSQSSISLNLDSYYYSQIQKLEQDIKQNQQIKTQLSLKVNQLSQTSQLINSQNNNLLTMNSQLKQQIQQLKSINSKLNDEIQILQFNLANQKTILNNNIKSLFQSNQSYKLQLQQLTTLLKNIESQQNLKRSSSLMESWGYRKADSIVQYNTLGNEIRQIFDDDPRTPTCNYFIKYHDAVNITTSKDTIQHLNYNYIQENNQRFVIKVNYVGCNIVQQGYFNMGQQTINVEDKYHQLIQIISVQDITKIQSYKGWLFLNLQDIDYVIQSCQSKKIQQYLLKITNIQIKQIKSIQNKAIRSIKGLVSLNSFSKLINNPSKILVEQCYWMGVICIQKRGLLRNSIIQQYGLLKKNHLLLFSDNSLRNIMGFIPISSEIELKKQNGNISIFYRNFKQYECKIVIKQQQERVKLFDQLIKIKQNIV